MSNEPRYQILRQLKYPPLLPPPHTHTRDLKQLHRRRFVSILRRRNGASVAAREREKRRDKGKRIWWESGGRGEERGCFEARRTCGGCHGLKTALPPSLSRSSRRSISAREPRAKIVGGRGGIV